jgi:hypothetical protein
MLASIDFRKRTFVTLDLVFKLGDLPLELAHHHHLLEPQRIGYLSPALA